MDSRIDLGRMDRRAFERFLRATIKEIRRVRREEPEKWARALEKAKAEGRQTTEEFGGLENGEGV